MATDVETQRQAIADSLCSVLGRLARARHFLTERQRMQCAMVLRDVADQLDFGACERAMPIQPLWRGPLLARRFVCAGEDADGCALYRLLG
jgi:hypothetical protein